MDDPRALRALPAEALVRVAGELRSHLVDVGSKIGGHFAGSLGAIELTVALHAVFDTPRDRVVWDIGHQAYGHKALTGRRDALWQIKKADGPAGFLRRCESAYDSFGAGHAGTSISAALGMAEAAARNGDTRRVVAVIGDGGATAGMAFEALNHAGWLRRALRVVYSDNGMSIAPTVGGLSRTGRVREYAEALGLRYLGPVDGHDLAALLPALTQLRDAKVPTLLHALTRKGKGFGPAEADPFRWHATSPFDRASGRAAKPSAGAPSWTSRFADALANLADRDPRLVAITAAMPDGTGLDRFAARHPDRMYDVGIAEQHAVTFAAGLACEGLRPVCAIYSTFLQRALDQIVHDVALQELPVTFALDRAGLVGADGPTHHGAFDLAYLRAIPNLVIAAPRDENELQHLLATAVESGRPFALRFPRGAAPGVPLDPEAKPLAIGRGALLRQGGDVALVALGKAVEAAMQAAERLAACGVDAAVVDARFAKPVDVELLTWIGERTGRIVSVEDHAQAGGFGSALLEVVSEHAPGVRVRRLGLPDRFVDHGDTEAQWAAAGIDADGIAAAARDLLEPRRA
ncbi:MAG TPA: 1-deoxy-D-xylulose-5-phosphate synthase [Myxococcota bacterium]|nr:1-deoxy-D-xylulose-5-phosphate synthase [Myxococcota bacterium]